MIVNFLQAENRWIATSVYSMELSRKL